jgi:hypothetical protein
MNSLAVMQPYFFPYIGYFQLINEVDKFVFYDDVAFIKRGWINRNRILINGVSNYITVPCNNISQNKLINEVKHALNEKEIKKLLKKLQNTYSRAPFFKDVFPLIETVFNTDSEFISDLAIESIINVSNYLNLDCEFKKSSENYSNQDLNAADRLIDICKIEGVNHYVNPIGGMELYSKRYFLEQKIRLDFLESQLTVYKQFSKEFVPGLSIIDLLMFNSVIDIKNELVINYNLI